MRSGPHLRSATVVGFCIWALVILSLAGAIPLAPSEAPRAGPLPLTRAGAVSAGGAASVYGVTQASSPQPDGGSEPAGPADPSYINIPDQASWLAYDGADGEIFAANGATDNVSVIDTASNQVVGTIPAGDDPVNDVYDSGTGEVFVANRESANVTVLDAATDQTVANIAIGSGLSSGTSDFRMTYAGRQGEVLVANPDTDNVSVISDLTNTIVANITFSGVPTELVYDPARQETFVANCTAPGADNVSVLDDLSGAVVANLALPGCPSSLAYDPGKGEIFASGEDVGYLWVINDTTNGVVDTITGGLSSQYFLAYATGLGDVFDSNGYNPWQTSVINDTEDEVVADIPPVGTMMVYDPGNGLLYGTGVSTSGMEAANLTLAATAVASVQSGPAVLNVTFNASAFGGSWRYSTWLWSFGDGGVASGENETHSYDRPGSYSATVTVMDSEGSEATSNPVVINVGPPLPIYATLSPSQLGADVGQPVIFGTSVSGAPGPYQYEYTWSSPEAGCASSSSRTVECLPVEAGITFNVSVRVSDPDGATSNATSSDVRVYPALDYSLTSSNSTLQLGQALALNAAASGGLGPYTFAYYDLPPGCTSTGGPEIACIPTQAGIYEVQGSVEDTNGWSVGSTLNVSVAFYFDLLYPSSTSQGRPMTIHVEVPGDETGLSYGYFGLPPGCGTENTQNLTCTPTVPGAYHITVNVSDAEADHASRTIVVYVSAETGLGSLAHDILPIAFLVAGLALASFLAGALLARRRESLTIAASRGMQAYGEYRELSETNAPVPLGRSHPPTQRSPPRR